MKLREKFKTEFSINTSGESGRFADKCEKIADEFAIEFGKWIINDAFSNNTIVYTIQDLKKLLEVYKKEKNL